jgi:uncharacterized protein (TIGR04255 family)
VQFTPFPGYRQIFAGDVWNLFKADYPVVEEHPPLDPTFETFGLPTRGEPQIRFIAGVPRCRFWFKRSDGTELIQFQEDRLLHNWKSVGDRTNEYPRYENVVNRFVAEVRTLESHRPLSDQSLSINQCEITYINHIRADAGQPLKPDDWLRFVTFGDSEPEDFTVGFREVIRDDGGAPQGRLTVEARTAYLAKAEKAIILALTVRGTPGKPSMDSAIEFLNRGRDVIVSRFTDMTTDRAHKTWERAR